MARALELMVGNRVSIVFFVSLQTSFGDHTRAASFRSISVEIKYQLATIQLEW
jgi:hypothetical protein